MTDEHDPRAAEPSPGPVAAGEQEVSEQEEGGPASSGRRRALAKLGLATAVAYSAPTLVRIDRSARAIILPSPCEDPPNFPPGFPPPFCPGGGGGGPPP